MLKENKELMHSRVRNFCPLHFPYSSVHGRVHALQEEFI